MNCPKCIKHTQLEAIERFGIEIDYCSNCRGIWLDRGEIDKIISKSQQESTVKKMTNLDFIDEAIYITAYNKVKDDFEKKRNNSLLKELFGDED